MISRKFVSLLVLALLAASPAVARDGSHEHAIQERVHLGRHSCGFRRSDFGGLGLALAIQVSTAPILGDQYPSRDT